MKVIGNNRATGEYTRLNWAQHFLYRLEQATREGKDLPRILINHQVLGMIIAWMVGASQDGKYAPAYNPLGAEGGTDFATYDEGIERSIEAVLNPRKRSGCPAIIEAIADQDPAAFRAAVLKSKWGTLSIPLEVDGKDAYSLISPRAESRFW